MDFLDQLVFREPGTDVATALHDAQGVALDQRGQGGFQHAGEVLVDRVHLEDHDLVFQEQLLEDVERGNGRDVAGPQNQRDPALALFGRSVIGGGGVGREVLPGDAVLHPDLGADAGKQEPVPDAVGRDARGELAVGQCPQGDVLQERLAVHLRERFDQPVAGAHQGIGAGHPFLALQGGARNEALGAGALPGPVARHGDQGVLDRLEDGDALIDRGAGPPVLRTGEGVELRLQGVKIGLCVVTGHGRCSFGVLQR